jgi:hypothetical protein
MLGKFKITVIISSILTKELNFIGRFPLGGKNDIVQALGKISLNMIYHTENKVGFARF